MIWRYSYLWTHVRVEHSLEEAGLNAESDVPRADACLPGRLVKGRTKLKKTVSPPFEKKPCGKNRKMDLSWVPGI